MSIGQFSIGEMPIAGGNVSPLASADGYFFNPWVTVLSQYANSPIITALVDLFAQWLDPQERFDRFYSLVWDIDTAQGYGLDVWGRILGVGRVLQVPVGEYLGFEQDAQAKPFGFGIFYSGSRLTNNVALTDDAYRTLLLAKAALNITNASAPAINTILLNLFGQGYVRDNRDMTITYVFSEALTPVETAIVFQSGVLPKPCGVSFDVEQP
jgi:Protein of unknown function (DUF2612).